MKILIDTNVILDVLIQREPFYIDSAKVWTLAEEEIVRGCISAITVNNLYYIIKKLIGLKQANSFVDQILDNFEVIALTGDILKQARTLPKKDYEDLIQYFSAIHEGCDGIVTRNKKDFPSIGIKLLSPPELLKMI